MNDKESETGGSEVVKGQQSRIRLDKRDVYLNTLPVEECGECFERPATCYIEIDLRAIGSTGPLTEARYCKECGETELKRIQDSLPEPLNEDGSYE